MAFEYSYAFSVDEDILSRYEYDEKLRIKYIFETKTNFTVKKMFDLDGGGDGDGGGGEEEEVIIDSERYALLSSKANLTDHLQRLIGVRLSDYWMPLLQIHDFLFQLELFTAILPRRRGRVPVAVAVNVCTVQREGEAIEAAVDRAMKTAHLAPLHLFPVSYDFANPERTHCSLLVYLRYDVAAEAVRVDDAEEGMRAMKECGVCRRKPVVGNRITRLECGHVFHYHCIVRWLEKNNACPKCRQPAYHIIDHGCYDPLSDVDSDYDSDSDSDSDSDFDD